MASKRTRAASFDASEDDARSSDELLTDAVSEEVVEAAPVRHTPAASEVVSSPTPEIVSNKPSAGEAAASTKPKNLSGAAKAPASPPPVEQEHVAGDPTTQASPVEKIASAAGADKEVADDENGDKRTEPSGGKDKRRKMRKKDTASAKAPLPETAGGNAEESELPEHAHAGNASPPKEKQQQPPEDAAPDKNALSTEGEKTSSDKALLLQQAETADGDGEESPMHAGNTSPPKEKENLLQPQPEEDAAAARAVVVPPQNKHALSTKGENNALSIKGEKMPAVELSWSQGDELKILTALVEHAKFHGGAMRDPADLFADLAGTFDKADANADKLNDKVRKLRTRYRKACLQGCLADAISRKLFKLSEILWSQSDEAEKTEAAALGTRDFSQLSLLYPHLAREVRRCASTSNSGELIMLSFETIGDDEARDLDARCKKQGIDMLKLEVDQADMTKEVLSALAARMN